MRAVVLLAVFALAGCATRAIGPGENAPYRAANLRPYSVNGRQYQPRFDGRYDQVGLASWYDYPTQTRKTASGERFDPRAVTAAHKTLPLPCMVEVTNLETNRRIQVRVNDRGPFAKGRLIDLSPGAAERLGMPRQGTVRVRVRFLGPAPIAATAEIGMAQMAHPAAADEVGSHDDSTRYEGAVNSPE